MLTLGLDADDTLWHNEDHYAAAQRDLEEMLAAWAEREAVSERLHEVQMANLSRFGYGAKSLTLSMIETAVDISRGEIGSHGVMAVIERGKQLLDRPVELIDGVIEVLDALSHRRLMLITKGDLTDQLAKIDRSGLAERFWQVEVMAVKDADAYAAALGRHDIDPARFVMVGNSVVSDVLPVLEIGGRAVHVPYHLTWRHERFEPADVPAAAPTAVPAAGRAAALASVPTLNSLRQLPGLLGSRGW